MKIKVGVLIFFLIVFGYTIYSAIRISATSAPDFSIFYYAGKDILLGISPYGDRTLFTAFNYPLVSALLFTPLVLFPYTFAQTFFTFANVASIFAIVYFCFILLKKRVSFIFFLSTISLVFLSFPTKFTIGMGQTNLLALMMLLWGFVLLQKKQGLWSMVFLILSIFFKPIVGITLVALLLEKEWRLFFLAIGFAILFALAIPILFHQQYANGVFLYNILNQSLAGREVYYNQGLLGFISRLTSSLSLRSVLNIFITIQLLFFTYWKVRKTTIAATIALLLTLLVIIDPLSWQHHFVFLILPFIAVFFAIQNRKKKNVLYMLLGISYVLVSANIKNPIPLQHFPLSLLLSNQFYGSFLLLLLEMYLL